MPYLDTVAAAAHCGVSKSFLDKRRLSGDGPSYSKLGKRVVYDVHQLDAWVRGLARRSTSQPDSPPPQRGRRRSAANSTVDAPCLPRRSR